MDCTWVSNVLLKNWRDFLELICLLEGMMTGHCYRSLASSFIHFETFEERDICGAMVICHQKCKLILRVVPIERYRGN